MVMISHSGVLVLGFMVPIQNRMLPSSSYNIIRSSTKSCTIRTATGLYSVVSKTSNNETDQSSLVDDKSVTLTSKQEYPKMKLNDAVQYIQPSKTVELFSMVKQMEMDQPNISITSLCVGEPDYIPPVSVLESIQNSISYTNHGGDITTGTLQLDPQQEASINLATKYTAVSGILSLRQAISNDLQHRKSVYYNPKTEILISNGAKQSVYQAIWAMAGYNDVVLIPSPYWPSYPEQVRLTGAKPVIIPTSIDNGYRLTPSVLQSYIEQCNSNNENKNEAVKVLVLCNPCNPTGTVYSDQELYNLCQVLYQYPDITVIADEIYERLVYSNSISKHISIASIPHMFHRTITINGFSKSHAMTGLRIGYSCAPSHITTAMTTMQSQLTSCANAISQIAAQAALVHTPDQWMDHVVAIMEEKRDFVIRQLQSMPHVILPQLEYQPTGAFYVLPDIHMYCRAISGNNADAGTTTDTTNDMVEYDDVTFCIELLQQELLAVVPGSSFGISGTIRISYATSMTELQIAMNKLSNFLSKKRIELQLPE